MKLTEENKRKIDKYFDDLPPGRLEELLQEKYAVEKLSHCIGVNATDDFKVFTLMRSDGQILLCRATKDEKAFWEEVNNLSKYFSAKIVEER